ncbi:MAG: DUF2835 domain-containing protein [Gammaproteobacteria bacterium]|nr:DUF2835 domain-containing protein [Gammaproteobacteria bacterium]MDH5650241.1 DUF2835 domain-containing protein [Gammaproteobacteria bacterium]
MNQYVRFALHIPAADILAYYQGAAKTVSVVSDDGRRIAFPADKLRPFVTEEGVFGEFEMVFDAQNRFIQLQRIK